MTRGFAALAASALAGCAAAVPEGPPVYLGIETRPVGADVVNLVARMQGGSAALATDYARCAVADLALRQGYGFARHVRTSIGLASGVHTADAVYTLSKGLPAGAVRLDADVIAADCRDRGIPVS